MSYGTYDNRNLNRVRVKCKWEMCCKKNNKCKSRFENCEFQIPQNQQKVRTQKAGKNRKKRKKKKKHKQLMIIMKKQ